MKIIVAEKGKFIETVRQYAGTIIAVLPHGEDWDPVLTSDDPFEALLQCRSGHCPTDPLE